VKLHMHAVFSELYQEPLIHPGHSTTSTLRMSLEAMCLDTMSCIHLIVIFTWPSEVARAYSLELETP